MRFMIDEPTPFDSSEAWEEYLQSLTEASIPSGDIDAAIATAVLFIDKTFGDDQ